MSDRKSVLCVVLSAVCFSLAGVLIKLLPWSPLTINGARSVFASCVILLWMRRRGEKLVFNRPTLLCAACNAAMNIAFVAATKLTTAANAIVLQFAMPVFLIVYNAVFFHKKPTGAQAAACAAVLVGIAFFFMDSLSSGGLIGDVLAVLSGAAYAVVFLTRRIHGADLNSSLVIGLWMNIAVGLPFFAKETACGAGDVAVVVLLGTVQLGLGFILLSRGLEGVQPVTAAITSTIEPILNPLVAAVFYPEKLGALSVAGAVIVLSSVGIYNIFTARRGG